MLCPCPFQPALSPKPGSAHDHKGQIMSTAHSPPLTPISRGEKAQVLTVAYKASCNPGSPTLPRSSHLTYHLPSSPSSHKGPLKLLEQAAPGPLHCCPLLLECPSTRELMGQLPSPCRSPLATCLECHALTPPASMAVLLFLLRT